jgi:hypothetical protein
MRPVPGVLFFDLSNELLEVKVVFRRDRTMVTDARERWLFNWWRDLEGKVHIRSAYLNLGPSMDLCIYNE